MHGAKPAVEVVQVVISQMERVEERRSEWAALQQS
jgi:hypothetical protein